MMDAKPLFIPLTAKYFDAFERGDKDTEYRVGKRWNERTCYPGRMVVLSRGYGKKRRLIGRIRDFRISRDSDVEKAAKMIYGGGPLDIACIKIHLQRLEINGKSEPWARR